MGFCKILGAIALFTMASFAIYVYNLMNFSLYVFDLTACLSKQSDPKLCYLDPVISVGGFLLFIAQLTILCTAILCGVMAFGLCCGDKFTTTRLYIQPKEHTTPTAPATTSAMAQTASNDTRIDINGAELETIVVPKKPEIIARKCDITPTNPFIDAPVELNNMI